MPNPTAGDVHINAPLTNVSLAFIQNPAMFVASRVFPSLPVSKQSDLFFTYDRGEFNRDQMRKRAPGTQSAGGDYDIDTDSYRCDVWALHKDIDDQVRANADTAINLDREATLWLTTQAMIRREKEFVSNFFTTSLWTTDITGVASSPSTDEVIQWSDYTNSDPISDIRTQKTAIQLSTGIVPNVLVLGQEVWDKIQDHPDLIDRIKSRAGVGSIDIARVTRESLAVVLELEAVEIMGGVENTATEGQANSSAFIGGKSALLLYRPRAAGLMTPSAGYTFTWSGLMGSAGQGTRVKRFRMDPLSSDRVEIEQAFDMKLVSADLGTFFTSIIA